MEKMNADSFLQMDKKYEALFGKEVVLGQRIHKHDEHREVYLRRFDLFEEQMAKFTQVLNTNKQDIFNTMKNNMEEQNVKVLKAIQAAQSLVEKVSSHSIKLTEQQTSVEVTRSRLDVLAKDVSTLMHECANLQSLKMDSKVCNSSLNELEEHQKKLYTQIALKENHIVTIENFIEKFLPIRVLNQVSECMQAMFPLAGDGAQP